MEMQMQILNSTTTFSICSLVIFCFSFFFSAWMSSKIIEKWVFISMTAVIDVSMLLWNMDIDRKQMDHPEYLPFAIPNMYVQCTLCRCINLILKWFNQNSLFTLASIRCIPVCSVKFWIVQVAYNINISSVSTKRITKKETKSDLFKFHHWNNWTD